MKSDMRDTASDQQNSAACPSSDVCVRGADVSARVNLDVVERFAVTIYGYVRNQCGRPAAGIILSLVQVCGDRLHQVAQTRTNAEGCYRFRIYTSDGCACFRVLAADTSAGCESLESN